MASDGSKFQEKNFTNSGKSANFYQIILQNTILDSKLEIPSMFIANSEDDLTSPIALKVPTGDSWEVELLKIGDKIWLEKGWQEFSEYHNLKPGHLLVFEFKGENHFHVSIFDMSAVEIDYKQNDSEEEEEEEEEEDDDDLEVEDLYYSVQESQGKLNDNKSICCGDLEAANNFIPKYPFFKSIFKNQPQLTVPIRFVSQELKCKSQRMMLQIEDKTWPVKLSVYPYKRFSRFTRGWPKFAEENSLQVNDVCFFQLIKSNVLLVSVFRTEG